MELDQVVEELENSNEFDLDRLPDYAVEQIGALCDEISTNLRTLACCAVLLEADTDTFYERLTMSGRLRRYYLDRCLRENPGLRDPYRATGNSGPMFDALAARDVALVRTLKGLSANEWWQGEEYAEDFHYANFFPIVIGEEVDSEDIHAGVVLLEAALDGSEQAKLETCRALSDGDQAAFDEWFELFLDDYEGELQEADEPFTPYEALAHQVRSQLCIEALAILNAAEQVGLQTREEYRFCPITARLPAERTFPDVPFVGAVQ